MEKVSNKDKAQELIDILKEYRDNIFVRIFLIFQFLTRLIITIWALKDNLIEPSDVMSILVIGFVADIITSSFFLPVIVLFQQVRYGRFFGHLAYSAILVWTLFASILFWDEFNTNFNFIAVDYLVYTHEIWGTLKESLPIYAILAGFGFISVLLALFSCRLGSREKPSIKLAIGALVIAITIGKFYNSEKFGPAHNKYAHEISKNGPYEFFYAFFNNSLDYIKYYPSTGTDVALKFARDEVKSSNGFFVGNRNLLRKITSKDLSLNKNVVVIMVESLSAEFLGHFGNKENITPNLDKLSKESLFFSNIYATGTRTVRGLEALTLSVPPLPGTSIIRRPRNANMFNIGTPFREQGYVTDFIYGGYSYFDNQQAFYLGNNFMVIDRGDLSKEEISFSNIWGVADEDIFNKAIEKYDSRHKRNKNFFSIIMTTSNHRPYNFPEGRIDLPSGGGRSAAVKYTDYAIGKFIEDARKKDWFKDTIFVITADHCASSAGKTSLPVEKYHIPLIIYSPSMIKPSINDHLGSQIDIGPTILGLLNFDYDSKFYGQDLTKTNPGRAFISTYQLLGYLKDNMLVILAPQSDPVTYRLEEGKKTLTTNQKLVDEAIAYYQSAYELFTNGQMREGL